MNTRLKEVMERLGSRPALIRMADVSDYFGDDAPYRIEDGVAFINISGPLSNAKWSWGGTTYGDIQNQIKIASADPNVRAVLLNVNSPGGETDNAFETAAMIKAVNKPVWAVAATSAYSAAYLLAAQADRIYITATSGGVGSIGVYCGHMDYSEMLKQVGIKVTLISAGEGKTDGNPWEPLTDDAKAEIQTEIDRLYGAFVGSVSTGRNINAADVIALGARTYDGAKAAIAAGLADQPGDLETAWVDLCSDLQRQPYGSLMRAGKRAATAALKDKNMNEQELAAKNAADIEAAKVQAGKDAHANAALITDICALAGKPELASGYLNAGKSVVDVRADLLRAKADAQAKTDLNTTMLPGTDIGTGDKMQGKAASWSSVFKSLGIRTKGATV